MAAVAAKRAAKAALRKEMKAKLKQIPETEKQRQSQVVINRLLESDFYKNSQRISVFLSMHDEIRTENLLKTMFQDKKDCFIPRYDGDLMEMVKLYNMADYDSLPETSWKIKQPTTNENRELAIATGGLDLILVPGLAFTVGGLRLGRGKGYYDTYLAKCVKETNKRPKMIAMAFKESIVEEIPTDEHDFVLDGVLYDSSN